MEPIRYSSLLTNIYVVLGWAVLIGMSIFLVSSLLVLGTHHSETILHVLMLISAFIAWLWTARNKNVCFDESTVTISSMSGKTEILNLNEIYSLRFSYLIGITYLKFKRDTTFGKKVYIMPGLITLYTNYPPFSLFAKMAGNKHDKFLKAIVNYKNVNA